jgi:hypothetical protein
MKLRSQKGPHGAWINVNIGDLAYDLDNALAALDVAREALRYIAHEVGCPIGCNAKGVAVRALTKIDGGA